MWYYINGTYDYIRLACRFDEELQNLIILHTQELLNKEVTVEDVYSLSASGELKIERFNLRTNLVQPLIRIIHMPTRRAIMFEVEVRMSPSSSDLELKVAYKELY